MSMIGSTAWPRPASAPTSSSRPTTPVTDEQSTSCSVATTKESRPWTRSSCPTCSSGAVGSATTIVERSRGQPRRRAARSATSTTSTTPAVRVGGTSRRSRSAVVGSRFAFASEAVRRRSSGGKATGARRNGPRATVGRRAPRRAAQWRDVAGDGGRSTTGSRHIAGCGRRRVAGRERDHGDRRQQHRRPGPRPARHRRPPRARCATATERNPRQGGRQPWEASATSRPAICISSNASRHAQHVAR